MARRRQPARAVSARTMAKREKRRAASAERARETQRTTMKRESLSQARVWERKFRRYQIAGLCDKDAAHAAWGHQIGWAQLPDPCAECQPLIDEFDTPGPRGSKWRKCLLKLEYLSDDEIAEIMGGGD